MKRILATHLNPIKRLIGATLITTALTAAVLANTQTYMVAKTPSSSVEFNFRVTLVPIPGKVNSLSADLKFDKSDLSKASGTIKVNLNKLDTGIGLRDEHARGYLGVEKHPNAIFSLKRINGIKTLEAGKEIKGTAVGSFDLNGIQKTLVAPITLKLQGKQIQVATAFDVTFADHNISIPGADSKVDVKVNFTLEP